MGQSFSRMGSRATQPIRLKNWRRVCRWGDMELVKWFERGNYSIRLEGDSILFEVSAFLQEVVN